MDIPQKLAVLVRAARALEERGVTWAVGGSLLLYCKGRARDFHDIDLMVAEPDAPAAREALLALGTLQPPRPADPLYGTKCFLEFTVDGVDIDVMAGFSIFRDGVEHPFPLRRADIRDWAEVDGVRIPLQSLAEWRTYYALMGREEKVRMIDG